ncbi:MAG: substrate-binding domain-containing protein [Bauldia sp.]|nr:substrate-binding domain-containing protein [Bauldia sp.]
MRIGEKPLRAALLAAAASLAIAGTASAEDMTADQIMAASGITEDTSFCGDKPITLGIHDGFGVNGWSKSSMAAVRSEAAKCPNVTQVVRIGQGDLQKSIADVNALVAEGVDALVIIPDFGKAQLPSLRAATDAGVKVVAWAADPGGTPGEDYVAYVDWDQIDAGMKWADWMAKALDNKGNIIFLGGPPGNPVSANALAGVKKAMEKYPDMTMLTGFDDWPVTNWDAALLQKTLTALLSKYPQVDGIINDSDGFTGLGVLRAYEAANKPLVPIATLEGNEFGCEYAKLKPDNADLELGTLSARTWMGRVAARKAIAAAQGLENNEPSLYQLPFYEDTLAGMEPKCDPDQPPDAFISVVLTPEQLETYGQTE